MDGEQASSGLLTPIELTSSGKLWVDVSSAQPIEDLTELMRSTEATSFKWDKLVVTEKRLFSFYELQNLDKRTRRRYRKVLANKGGDVLEELLFRRHKRNKRGIERSKIK